MIGRVDLAHWTQDFHSMKWAKFHAHNGHFADADASDEHLPQMGHMLDMEVAADSTAHCVRKTESELRSSLRHDEADENTTPQGILHAEPSLQDTGVSAPPDWSIMDSRTR